MASRSWNRVELIGNLTRDPELRYTPNGIAVCTIGLATNKTYTTSDGERREETEFHRLVAWRKLAEICNQYLKKGMKVFVSGRLQYREWEPQEGQKRRDAEISMDDMVMLTPKNGEWTGGATAAAEEKVSEETPQVSKAKETEEVPEKEEPAPEKAPQEEFKDDLPF